MATAKTPRAKAITPQQAFTVAMVTAQRDMAPVNADMGNPLTASKYASHQALDRVLRPIYTANGFSLCFNTADSPLPNNTRVLCDVSHIAGHEKPFHIDIPNDGKAVEGADVMTKTHAAVSAVSIGIRALLRMIFNIVIERKNDDDGNAAGASAAAPSIAPPAPGCISHEQAREIRAALDGRVVSRTSFLHWAGVARVEDIAEGKFDSCIAAIGNFKKKAA